MKWKIPKANGTRGERDPHHQDDKISLAGIQLVIYLRRPPQSLMHISPVGNLYVVQDLGCGISSARIDHQWLARRSSTFQIEPVTSSQARAK